MKQYLRCTSGRSDPSFRLAGDGVHIDATGLPDHRPVRRLLALGCALSKEGGPGHERRRQAVAAYPHGLEVLKLVTERQRLLRDAWLTATGHKRPGMKTGLPLDEADRRAGELNVEIDRLLKSAP